MRTCLVILAAVSILVGFVWAVPKPLPPEGSELHTWYVRAFVGKTTNTLVLNGIEQAYWKETAYPRRAFGRTIKLRWFGEKPSLFVIDDDGNTWLGEMVK